MTAFIISAWRTDYDVHSEVIGPFPDSEAANAFANEYDEALIYRPEARAGVFIVAQDTVDYSPAAWLKNRAEVGNA